MDSLTLHFVPHMEIEHLSSVDRINKFIKLVKGNKIVLLEGRLRSHEEAELIQKTMEEIDDKFKGIELSVINPDKKDNRLMQKLKVLMINILLKNRTGFTIVGPASVVREIKQDPDKIQLFMHSSSKSKKGD